jgi:hypothetical protein
MGTSSTAVGSCSTAIGYGATGTSYNSFAIGKYNVGGGTGGSWVSTDPLFEIGNGTSPSGLADALLVLKNGNTTIYGADNELPNQTLTGASNSAKSILTKGIADGLYLPIGGGSTTSLAYFPSATATGTYSAAIGNSANASGNYASAFGTHTTAGAYASTAIGRYNLGTGSGTSWTGSDPLFEVGNGTSTTAADALLIYKNGNAVVQGTLTTGGTITTAGLASTGTITVTGTVTAPTFITTAGAGDIPMFGH